jgi:PAS domain S-box-containing protein
MTEKPTYEELENRIQELELVEYSFKRAEMALQESEGRYRAVVEDMPGLICSFLPGGEITFVNKAYCEYFSETFEELVGTNFLSLIPESEQKAVMDNISGLKIESPTQAHEHRVIAPNGDIRWQRWTNRALFDDQGKTVGYQSIGMDITERKRAEQAVREERDRLEAVTRNLGVGLAVISKDYRTVWANETLRERFGEVVGQACFEAYSGRAEICSECGVREVFEAGAGPVVHEQSGIDAGGKTTWSQIIASPMRDEAGEITAAVELVVPITERKQAEERLRFQKTLLEAQNEASIDGILVVDPEGRMLSFNRRFAEMWEIPDEIVQASDGDKALAFVLGRVEDPEGFRAKVRYLYAHTDEPSRDELRLKDGRVFDRYSAPVRSAAGEHYGRMWIFRDVTERERSEAALRQSEEKFRILAETSPDYIYQVDAKGEIIYASTSVEQITGYKPQELIGRRFSDLINPSDLSDTMEKFQTALSQKGKEIFELRFIKKDGTTIDVETHATTMMEDGKIVGVQGITRDITHRKREEEERRRLEAKVQHAQKLESLGVMAGGIAHDFNNLLMGILGNADLALLKLAPESPGREGVDRIVTAARRAAELTNQMLAYSGKGRFVVGPIELNRLVTEMGHLLETVISKKAAMQFHLTDRLPAIEADASQVRQVVMNLITNASEALAEESGTIGLSTGVVEADETYLSESELGEDLAPGHYVSLEVSDTGTGMDAETRQRIFDPFFTTKFIGRGLGLAAVQGIVRGHKGAIRVYSEPGRGSTVEVLFPASEKVAREKEPRAPAPEGRTEGVTILLVDDDPQVREVAEAMLTEPGFRVLTAADGREGVETYRRHCDEIAVVVLDMTMPEMSGEEAFREIRRIRADACVVLSSGYNEQDATSRFAGKGLAGFIQKPYRSAELLARIHEVLAPS